MVDLLKLEALGKVAVFPVGVTHTPFAVDVTNGTGAAR